MTRSLDDEVRCPACGAPPGAGCRGGDTHEARTIEMCIAAITAPVYPDATPAERIVSDDLQKLLARRLHALL